MAFQASAKRDTPVKENLRLFDLLLKGDKEVEAYCLRAKADYKSVNGKDLWRVAMMGHLLCRWPGYWIFHAGHL